MAQVCTTTQYTADAEVFSGTPLVLDQWLNLGEIDLTSAVVTLYDFDINVIGDEGGGVIGDEGGSVVGPE